MKSSRAWEMVLYPDADNYDASEVLAKASEYFNQWVYILHDKDISEDGTPKKTHFHFYGKVDTPRTPQTISNAMGVGEAALRNVSNWRSAVRYAAHLDNPEKYQYPVDALTSNFPLAKMLTVDDDSQAVRIFSFIMDSHCSTVTGLTRWCIEQGFYSGLRRGFAVWSRLLAENSGS